VPGCVLIRVAGLTRLRRDVAVLASLNGAVGYLVFEERSIAEEYGSRTERGRESQQNEHERRMSGARFGTRSGAQLPNYPITNCSEGHLTVTLISLSEVRKRSLARPRMMYSPGFVNATVVCALPSFTGVVRCANVAAAGPRQTVHVTVGP